MADAEQSVEIPQAFAPEAQSGEKVTQAPPKKRSSAGIIIVLIVAALVSLGATAYILFFYNQKSTASTAVPSRQQQLPEQTVNPPAQPTVAPPVQLQPTDAASGSADLPGYTNTKYGYSVLYPTEWTAVSMMPADPLPLSASVNFRQKTDQTPAESGIAIMVLDNPQHLSLKDWLAADPENGTLLPASGGVKEIAVTYNGISWEQVTGDSVGMVPTGSVVYATVHGAYLYVIGVYETSGETSAVADKMVRTFRFVTP